ncbi:hypothetical protein PR048_022736 [Dryococelus australis]|uniref:Uncharacterized protein n=1 Tax=Dryococelus australis TaxID=614101 RepID=A0ABQ9GS31_9NEOP|nr:hypothetical protein PR048_022736 [Dryococelus australis]
MSAENNLKDNPPDPVMQIDVAENYSLVHQDEIQTAHWSHSQVSTCCLWHEKGVKSHIVISNDLKHSKVFCLGYRNRFSVTNLCFSKADFGLTNEWDYFASELMG